MNELELRDIHLPDTSLWWPPAPGWWLLLLLVVLLGASLPWLLRQIKHRPVKYYSLRELRRIRESVAAGQDLPALVTQVNGLLRRTVISYRGRRGVAASTGDDWMSQLGELSPRQEFSPEQLQLLTHDRYQRNCDGDIESLLQACERWLRSLPRGQSRVSD